MDVNDPEVVFFPYNNMFLRVSSYIQLKNEKNKQFPLKKAASAQGQNVFKWMLFW